MGIRKLLPSSVGGFSPQAAGEPSQEPNSSRSASVQHVAGSTGGSLLAGGGGFRDPLRVYLEGLAAGGRVSARSALSTVAKLLGGELLRLEWWELRPPAVLALRSVLRDRYAPGTANRMLSSLRGVLRVCWRLELLTHEQLERLLDVPCVRGTREPRGRAIEISELRAVLDACGDRDRTLVVVMVAAGLRVSEAAGLRWSDWDPEAGTLTVIGKGNRQRVVPLHDAAAGALTTWSRGHQPTGLVFGLGPRAIQKMLRRRAEEAGVAAFTPHDLRRTFVSALLDAGADLSVAQQLAGHADPRTTAGYDRRPERARRAAVDRLELP